MNKYAIGVMTLAAVAALAVAVPTFAQSTNASANTSGQNNSHRPAGAGGFGRGQGMGMSKQSLFGTVSAVSGNTITVLGHSGPGKSTATTTYTVDATNAKVTKNNVVSTVSAIAVGDTVGVQTQAAITGTNVVATTIRDGIMARPGMGFGRGQGQGSTGTTTSPITGNGQPIVAGKISSVSGSTISIVNSSNVTYTVDASNAKIVQGNTTASVSNLNTGDTIIVQGTVNGTSIVASSVIDQTKPATSGQTSSHPSFFGGIGQFFMHLFGF